MTAKNCGDFVTSKQEASPSRDLTPLFPRPPAENTRRVVGGDPASSGVLALTVEFVAKPQVARRVKTIIPATIAGAFEGVTGFAGYLVMVSDQEPRLVTVVTLWRGDDRSKLGCENARWVCELMAPYLDRCLRVQTSIAHLPRFPANPKSLEPVVKSFSPARSADEDEIYLTQRACHSDYS
jgi:hypothetical protein